MSASQSPSVSPSVSPFLSPSRSPSSSPSASPSEWLANPCFVLADSSYITAGGEVTTAQLTAPAGKASGTHFQAGRIQDDSEYTNIIDLTANKYTEVEWCINATDAAEVGSTYQFRATKVWKPTDISGCVLWLRSDLGVTQSGGLVSQWADQSGNNNHLTQTVEAKKPIYTAGSPSYLDFDGIAQCMDVPNNASLNLTTAVTVLVWNYADAVSAYDILFNKHNGGDPYPGYSLWRSGGADPATGYIFSINTYNVNYARHTNTTLSAWQLGAGTYDKSNIRVFVNNDEGTPKAYTSDISVFNDTGGIGYRVGWSWFNGRIDQIAIYNVALTTEQLTTFYNNTRSRYEL